VRPAVLACAGFLWLASSAQAEWQFKPFVGVTFGGGTTFVDLEQAAGTAHVAAGGSVTLLGEWLGIEGDVGRTFGFFETGGQHLVTQSGVTTVTGNAVVAMPRHLTQYGLRPYGVGGAGVVRVNIEDVLGVLKVSAALPVFDVGGGVTGFLNNYVGLNWDVRYFRSMTRTAETAGLSFGAEQISFWRASMALAIRY
jgi:hypothetical protein